MKKNICDDVKNNPKIFWKYVNNKRKITVSIPQLHKANTNKKVYWETDYDKAEALASQFSNVFTTEGENTWNIEEKTLPDSKLVISFDAATILKKLNDLNIGKSSGLGLVNAKILKELAEPIAPVLSIIFKTSKWKEANIMAIYKKYYCPISLTSIICEIMESLVKETLLEFLKNTNVLSETRFGFVTGRLTVLQLLNVLGKWTEALDNGAYAGAMYCNFMKAFDTVPHQKLLRVLRF